MSRDKSRAQIHDLLVAHTPQSPAHCTKGLPFGADLTSSQIERNNWNILRGDLPFPLLVLKESALDHNLRSMAQWCAKNNVLFAPHGKTTMCPQLFARQLDAGAWAITVANVSQAMVCASFGVQRILIANQVVGTGNIQLLVQLLRHHPEIECFLLVDSVDGVRHLADSLKKYESPAKVGVLLEWGRKEWRTGVRSEFEALRVAAELVRHDQVLEFVGVEAYEGLASSEEDEKAEIGQVEEFFSDLLALARKLRAGSFLQENGILSVGGTSVLDLVSLFAEQAAREFAIVVRSGCYITSDHGFYAEKLSASHRRLSAGTPVLEPAFELWSYVQSIPEPGLAFLTFGKRDCSHDLGFPTPLLAITPDTKGMEQVTLRGCSIFKLNDQHAYMSFPTALPLEIGTLVCCGISHPCTAFDKWRVIPVVSDDYRVIDLYKTFF
jgi:D-serine dehydratase